MAETDVSERAPSAGDLAVLSEGFESEPASSVVRWAVDTFGDSLVLAASFEDIVLVDLATKVDPEVEVVFLDTEAHFPETLDFVEEIRARYGLNLTVTRRPRGRGVSVRVGSVLPVPQGRAVTPGPGRQAGLVDVAQAVGRDNPRRSADRGMGCRIRPGQGEPAGDLDRGGHLLVPGRSRTAGSSVHPSGYRSIGCAPTTRPVAEGEDARAGRWSGLDKSECGLHI